MSQSVDTVVDMCAINMVVDTETLLRLGVTPDVVAGFLASRSTADEIAAACRENLSVHGGRSTPENLRHVLPSRPASPEVLQTRRILAEVLADAERRARRYDEANLDGGDDWLGGPVE